MAAAVACCSVNALTWTIGSGPANKCRTDLSIKIGKGEFLIARKFAFIC